MVSNFTDEYDPLLGGYHRIGGYERITPPNPRKTQMTKDQIHEIAKLAAEAANNLNSMTLHGVTTALPTPKAGAEAVVDAYLAAVKRLSAEQPSKAHTTAA